MGAKLELVWSQKDIPEPELCQECGDNAMFESDFCSSNCETDHEDRVESEMRDE